MVTVFPLSTTEQPSASHAPGSPAQSDLGPLSPQQRPKPFFSQPATSPREFAVSRLGSLSDHKEFSDEWSELCDQHGGAIEHFDWVAACAGRDAVDVIVLREQGELSAVAGLTQVRRRGVSRLSMIGVDVHFEPMEFLARDGESMRRLCEAVAATGRPISCGRIPADSETLHALKAAYARRGLLRIRPQAATPWIALDDSWTSPESHLNGGRRSDLRRARKRAEEMGDLTVEIMTPSLEQLPGLLDEAFVVEGRSWKGSEQTALQHDSERGEFFRRYAEMAGRQGTLRMCFLRIGGHAVAMQIAVEQSRRFWLLKVGYDAAFSRCSPGMLMTRETIAYAANRKLLSYEFLGTCEPWTDVWTDRRRECVSFTAYPWSAQGLAALAVDSAVAGLVRLKLALQSAAAASKRRLQKTVKAVVGRAARRYVAGETVESAIRVRDAMGERGCATTLGFWDGEGDTPRAVADRYLAALETMHDQPQHAYLSIKLPALNDSAELLDEVAGAAVKNACRLHFDALTPESVEQTQGAIDGLRSKHPALSIGYTLPGRWSRSLADADWAVARGLSVRVVKGQFAAAGESERDPHEGFLHVIGRLAGRAKHVDIATHDEALAAEAAAILKEAATPFDREVLFGMGRPDALRKPEGPAVRVYIPYGAAYLPYAVAKLRKNPGVAGRLVWDWMKSLLGR